METPSSSSIAAASAPEKRPVTGATATPPEPPRRGLGARILKAGVIVLCLHVCMRLSGFVLLYWVANKYEDGVVVSDVYNVIWDSVLTTAFLIGEQCLGPAYLPIFTRAWKAEGEARAWEYSSILFNTQAIILILIVAVLMIFPAQVIALLTEWAPGSREELLAHQMLPWAALGLLGMSLSTLTSMLLNGYKEFFWAIGGDLVMKIAVLFGAVAGTVIGKGDWHYIALGIMVGGTLALLTHVAALGFRRLRQYRFSLNWSDPYVKAFVLLILPLVLGIVVSRVRDTVMIKVLTSQEGLPTIYKLGKSITGGVNSLIPYALSIALLPYFCDISARDDNKHLGQLLTTIVRMLVWFFVPLSIVLAAAAFPTCMALFAGKKIQAGEAGLSALVVQIFCFEMPFAAIEMMIMQAFFSSRRMIAPTLAGLLFSGLSALAAYGLVKMEHMTDPYEIIVTVSLCLVLARVFKVIVLISLLKLTVPVLPWGETAGFLIRLALSSVPAGVVAFATAHFFQASSLSHALKGRAGNIVQAIVIGVAGSAVYLAISLILKMEEPRECLQWAREKLKRRGAKAQA